VPECGSLRVTIEPYTTGGALRQAITMPASVSTVATAAPLQTPTIWMVRNRHVHLDLPASLFPEFAVHPLNLVPCCSICNAIKGNDWPDTGGRRLYLHAYSDILPAEAFLNVALKTSKDATGVGAVFWIERPPGFRKDAWSLIESYFDRLNLIERYTDLSNDEIAEILTDCRIYLDSGGKMAQAFLKSRAKERTEVYGPSHWQLVLMDKIARSSKLDEWIAQPRRGCVLESK
jgi:hypothetical protein